MQPGPRPPGTAIGISAGTTTYALARRLVDVPGLTVATNSVPVAEVLYGAAGRGQTIILTGGVRTPSDALVGPFAVAALRTIHLDLVFMGVHGMDPRSGFTTPNVLEADTDRALVEAGRRLIVVADHTKWGVIGISSFARLDRADVLSRMSGCPTRRKTPFGPAFASSCSWMRPRPCTRSPRERHRRSTPDRPHRRYDPLRDEWVLVSAGRTGRPWQGATGPGAVPDAPTYDPTCYLCPGNVRANGQHNPAYDDDVRVRQRLRRAAAVDGRFAIPRRDSFGPRGSAARAACSASRRAMT